MKWTAIETQEDLQKLDDSKCWDDSRVLEYYSKMRNEPYFPADVSRGGSSAQNVHVLLEADSKNGQYLEIVFIYCDWISADFFRDFHLSGRVDPLRRIVIQDQEKSALLRCSRLVYRFLDSIDLVRGSYFKNSDSVT